MATIALLTDFGSRDWFVGSMKGVIHSINPAVSLIDISHKGPVGDIRSAAFSLLACYRYFPEGTVFVTVVDPGVGGDRSALVVDIGAYKFVGPDNGVFSFVLREHEKPAVFRIENKDYFRKPVSTTFHGRDVFAPVGAHLTKGVPPEVLGPELKQWITIAWPDLILADDAVTGAVIYIDHFGNAITNITAESINHIAHPGCRITEGTANTIPLVHYYDEVPQKEVCALVNSAGYVEIAVNGGNAAEQYSLSIDREVSIFSKARQYER